MDGTCSHENSNRADAIFLDFVNNILPSKPILAVNVCDEVLKTFFWLSVVGNLYNVLSMGLEKRLPLTCLTPNIHSPLSAYVHTPTSLQCTLPRISRLNQCHSEQTISFQLLSTAMVLASLN